MLWLVETKVAALSGLERRPIALTNQFHVGYRQIHLLMGMFYLGKLFKYAMKLPKRIFYQETHFRHFCWRLCEALQASNAEYNINNNLLRANGYLSRGGMRSLGSSLPFTPAVVSAKECPFCLRRAFNNMGSHMAMAHGDGARNAREIRDIRAMSRD